MKKVNNLALLIGQKSIQASRSGVWAACPHKANGASAFQVRLFFSAFLLSLNSATALKTFGIYFAALLLCLSLDCTAKAQVFCGAVGFGVDTQAGTNGRVIRVTNLNAEGPGSLREAVEAEGERLVVFEVGGVIDLEKNSLLIRSPYLTIAGQTAPSPGITVIRGGFSIRTHDVLMQHIRARPGDAGDPTRSGWEPDGLTTAGGDAYNIVIDHCSFTWAVDENLSASGPRTEGPQATSHQITFSNCIIAEGLNDSTHSKGSHSKGTLIHDYCQNIAIIGNLFAHNYERNPYFKAFTTGVIVNNVIYNPGSGAIKLGYYPPEWDDVDIEPQVPRLSIVGNVLYHGCDTRESLPLITRGGKVYVEDNQAWDVSGEPVDIHNGEIDILENKPIWPEGLTPLPAEQTVEHVIKNAGARPWDRDTIDKRIIQDFRQRQGRIIDSQDQVGGYPTHEPSSKALEVPDQDRHQWLQSLENPVTKVDYEGGSNF